MLITRQPYTSNLWERATTVLKEHRNIINNSFSVYFHSLLFEVDNSSVSVCHFQTSDIDQTKSWFYLNGCVSCPKMIKMEFIRGSFLCGLYRLFSRLNCEIYHLYKTFYKTYIIKRMIVMYPAFSFRYRILLVPEHGKVSSDSLTGTALSFPNSR